MIDGAVRLADVLKRALFEAAGRRIIFFLVYIVVRLFEGLDSLVEAIGPLQVGINRRMIVQVFAVVDGSTLDLADGRIDFPDGLHGVVVDAIVSSKLVQESAGKARSRPAISARVPAGGVLGRIADAP